MVQRGENGKPSKVRSMVVPDVTGRTLAHAIRNNIDRRSRLMTDEYGAYKRIGKEFEGGHHSVRHSAEEYVRGDVYTNTVESYFNILKKGITGIYHSVSKQHLHRYLAEFEFRYNNRELRDGERVIAAIEAADGKRLRYRDPVDGESVTQPTQLAPKID